MAITTRDSLIAAMAAGRKGNFLKLGTGLASGTYNALFRSPGNPSAAAIPSTAAGNTCDRTLLGAIWVPAASGTSYLTGYQGWSSLLGCVSLCDRLVETGTLVGNLTSAQTVNSVPLPARAGSGDGVELWLEWYTAGGTGASATVTASYTNSAGTAGRAASVVGGFTANGATVGRMYPMVLQGTDIGVQSVQSVTLSASTGGAGAFGVVLRKMLLHGRSVIAYSSFTQGWAETLMRCGDAPCFELVLLATSAGTVTVQGNVSVGQG